MKLYATTTSERASKGQGGNKFIHIDLKNEDNETVAKIAYTDSGISMMYTSKVYAELEQVDDLIETKGEKLKTAKVTCKKCGKSHNTGTREATRDFVLSDICIKCNKE